MSLSTAQRIGLLDLTRLEAVAGDEAAIEALCARAQTPLGAVAAVCVHPAYVALAQGLLQGSSVAIATVVNFPGGEQSIRETQKEVENVLADGAEEIDVVVPYKAWLAGDHRAIFTLLEAMQHWVNGRARIKAILETGAIPLATQRIQLAQETAATGVTFLKTSTGKSAVGATLEAVKDLMQVVHEYRESGRALGIKVAGGVRSSAQLKQYLQIIETHMGSTFLAPDKVRIGASALLDNLLQEGMENDWCSL
ncbi:deoxyribose-phosphate aldolase [Acidithiobacillus ferrivorans]|uniref:deoxyribose-phosphate aldolase n=1 Tax=Acidithiobacillus ferrivorans TaxID=160808 RepID=UPI000A7C2B29|nr:deoxyribose-phosphate aldolase [Acidithiobacillus ferrivorans]